MRAKRCISGHTGYGSTRSTPAIFSTRQGPCFTSRPPRDLPVRGASNRRSHPKLETRLMRMARPFHVRHGWSAKRFADEPTPQRKTYIGARLCPLLFFSVTFNLASPAANDAVRLWSNEGLVRVSIEREERGAQPDRLSRIDTSLTTPMFTALRSGSWGSEALARIANMWAS